MKKKMIYDAPDAELVEVRVERNIMSERSSNAPGMTSHSESEWGDWEN